MTTPADKAPPAGRRIASPNLLPEAQPYWDAANEGRLLVKGCRACGQPHFYPRDVCPHCLSDDTEWRDAAGTGTIYSYSTMGKGAAAYTLGFVSLDEGVTMMTNLVGCDPAALFVGQRVKVVFETSERGQAVPMFTPL